MHSSSSSKNLLAQIVSPLLKWYHLNKRDLAWRQNPPPYFVWVSEIMLQQTRVEAVKSYFERFTHALPDIESLANCPEDQLLKLWEGLGYYSRVKNMKKAAIKVLSDYGGKLPSDPELLKTLPGIGDYTAGAVASIAFDVPVPAVDGNVLRVLSRVLCCEDDISLPATKAFFTKELLQIEPTPGAGDFNQSLMELGATVCLPNGTPQCLCCPLCSLCCAHKEGKETLLPVKLPKKARKIEERTLFVLNLSCDGVHYTLLHRRPQKGVLKNMWEFPACEKRCSKQEILQSVEQISQSFDLCFEQCIPLKPFHHIFTHIEWKLSAQLLQADCADKTELLKIKSKLPEDFILIPVSALSPDALEDAVALPSAFRPCRDVLIKN